MTTSLTWVLCSCAECGRLRFTIEWWALRDGCSHGERGAWNDLPNPRLALFLAGERTDAQAHRIFFGEAAALPAGVA